MKTQRIIVTASQFAIDLKSCIENHQSLTEIYERQTALEEELDTLTKEEAVYIEATPSSQSVDGTEAVVAKALRNIGRLKLNR